MQLGRDWIERHIPHRYAMCLLDSVLTWDDAYIFCQASSHQDPLNPLRAHGRLGAVCAIEYAAQAMAVHGSLRLTRGRSEEHSSHGYLTGVRNVLLGVERLDTIRTKLDCKATRVTGDALGILYTFEVSAGGVAVASGRATVILDAKKTHPNESEHPVFGPSADASPAQKGERA